MEVRGICSQAGVTAIEVPSRVGFLRCGDVYIVKNKMSKIQKDFILNSVFAPDI